MPVTINASTSAGLIQTADTSGTIQLQSNGTTKLTVSSSGVNIGQMNGGAITAGTAVTASGTSVDFTGIPSWAKRVTVIFSNLSTNGTSLIQVQIGSGSVTTSGYTTAFVWCVQAGPANTGNNGSGFPAFLNVSAANAGIGTTILNLVSSNNWIGNTSTVTPNGQITQTTSAGSLSLGGALDRVRITTLNGTDTFDAGSINIQYEG